MVKRPDGQWAMGYKKCKKCGSTKKKHKGGGYCTACYGSIEIAKKRCEKRKKDQPTKSLIPPVKTPFKKRSGRPEEWTSERIEIEAIDLEQWSKQNDALILEEFGLYRNPPYVRAQMYDLGHKNKRFSSALVVARERIRSRREKGAVVGEFNSSVMQFTHAFYDRDNNNKDQSFTSHKKEMKASEKAAEGQGMAQALIESKQFVDEAKAKFSKKKKVVTPEKKPKNKPLAVKKKK